jgi:hypothetical protein
MWCTAAHFRGHFVDLSREHFARGLEGGSGEGDTLLLLQRGRYLINLLPAPAKAFDALPGSAQFPSRIKAAHVTKSGSLRLLTPRGKHCE